MRDLAPTVPLLANLGAVQLNYGYGVSECEAAVKMIGADALALHANALQEAIQPEGQCDFSGLLGKIRMLVADDSIVVHGAMATLYLRIVRGLARSDNQMVDVEPHEPESEGAGKRILRLPNEQDFAIGLDFVPLPSRKTDIDQSEAAKV